MNPARTRVSRAAAHFRDAAAFLTRLVPPRADVDAAALSTAVPWFPVVGAALGLLCAAAAWLTLRLPAGAAPASYALTSPLSAGLLLGAALAAWVWLLVSIWSTRGLHWDGLADLADACGSNARGERFWEILRDSRLGAFGALALLLVFSGQWISLALHIASGHWLLLAAAPAWGGACAVWCAAAGPAREAASLGGLAHAGARPAVARGWAVAALLFCVWLWACGLPAWQAAALPLGQYALIRAFARQGREQGGLSGDFLGAAVEVGRLWFLLLTL